MIVRAKRAGYTESLSAEKSMDLEPLSEKEYESVDLEGELREYSLLTEFGVVRVVLVGGQEADPTTVQPI